MAYQTLYRKWRPKTFDEVVGQNHITSTLKNELLTGRTTHAYIFTGTRGTGKTSTAKILSRALNCENPKDGNPCNECPSCKGILDESILDVVEFDAASNGGVDNIREIIDQVRYSTASTRYKVYIIDEVHMLSIDAFNALLKTLEEPPQYVVFILATTEIHKVPVTILSRCQRFDFKNITSADISGAVGRILTAEGVNIEKEAVDYIAYLGNGSMRDALSITEQCLAYKTNDITYSDITEILGTLDDSFLYSAAEHIANGNVRELLILFNNCIKKGKNPDSFADGMMRTLRDILFYTMAPEICDFTDAKKALLAGVSGLYTKDKLVRCIDILGSAIRDIKLSSNTAILVETTFIRMASPEYVSDISALIDRISTLENKIARGNFQTVQNAPVQNTFSKNTLDAPPLSDAAGNSAATEAVNEKPQTYAPPTGELADVINGWENVKRYLEDNGKLISFVSLYGVVPRCEGSTLILAFDDRDSASRFSTGSGKTDLAFAINELYGANPEIKCVFEEKTTENTAASNEIFDNLAKISTDFPENFKID